MLRIIGNPCGRLCFSREVKSNKHSAKEYKNNSLSHSEKTTKKTQSNEPSKSEGLESLRKCINRHVKLYQWKIFKKTITFTEWILKWKNKKVKNINGTNVRSEDKAAIELRIVN